MCVIVMARPLEKDYGAKQTTITLPFTVWESLKRENINVSEECAKHLTILIKHPGFKKKQIEKERINDILKYVNPSFLKNMKKRIKEDKNTANHWKNMLSKKHEIEIDINDLIKWAFDDWGDDS